MTRSKYEQYLREVGFSLDLTSQISTSQIIGRSDSDRKIISLHYVLEHSEKAEEIKLHPQSIELTLSRQKGFHINQAFLVHGENTWVPFPECSQVFEISSKSSELYKYGLLIPRIDIPKGSIIPLNDPNTSLLTIVQHLNTYGLDK
jgi:hypothetical protein